MKSDRVNMRDDSRRVLTYFGSLCLGLAVFAGTASFGAKEDLSSIALARDSREALRAPGISSTDSSSKDSSLVAAGADTATATDERPGRQRKAAPVPGQPDQDSSDPPAVELANEDSVMHVGRVIGGIPVASKGGQVAASRTAGELGLGEPCSCDQDCAAVGDECNPVQCIVRSFCTGNAAVACEDNADCEEVNAGTCTPEVPNCFANNPPNCNFVQRCDIVQLIGGAATNDGRRENWPCDADGDYCTADRCTDDGTETSHSVCVAELDGSGSPLSPCPKQCVGGPSSGLRCSQSSECSQGACQITAGGGCDSAAEACYVGASLSTAIGRCCTAGACTETDEATCTGGDWYRYSDPEDQEGDGNCACPKYGSGVAPSGADLGTEGLVRPSGLICDVGTVQTNTMVYCEDLDLDGLSPQFCQKRCVGGDNVGAPCVVDNPDCGKQGLCSIGGTSCLVEEEGADCGLCEGLDPPVGCDAPGGFFPCPGGETCLFEGGQTCNASNPGQCVEDSCVTNFIEGGCEDGFLNIGDDYSIENGSFLRLSQFRFRGGVTNLREDFAIEFWDSTGTKLVDAFAVLNLGRTGTHDWTIEVDCFPNCNPGQLEVPEQNPIIIPPIGYVVMRSTRTVGTLNGAAAFWSQTDNPADVGLNDDTKAWVNNDPNGSLGTNVFIFELVGTKVDDPLGACCDDALSCEDTVRWECGICTQTEPQVLCASTILDCPDRLGLNSICQFNRWFGPISHDDFIGGGADLTLCNGISPCDTGACCDGSSCSVTTEANCNCPGCFYRGIATDCSPNCCPVAVPTGSDCVCPTSMCVEADGITVTQTFCDTVDDCDPGQTCVLQCVPTGVTQLRHPYECHDDLGSPLEPALECDPANGDADCTSIDPPNTDLYTCERSFVIPYLVVTNDSRADVDTLFVADDGDACSINPVFDRVGWYELITLEDPTPGLCHGDGATQCDTNADCDQVGGPCVGDDDCFILTVGLCCTEPIMTPIWPFLSSYANCPCSLPGDVIVQAPDTDLSNDLKAGYGANSKAHFPCEDGNYAATFTVPPGDYAYQVDSDTACSGSIIPCENDDDCPGSSCNVGNPDYSVVFTTESCQIAACCVAETCVLTNELDCALLEGNFLGGGNQPIVTCQSGACSLGSCCVDGTCKDDEFSNTVGQCVGQDGNYFGGVSCDTNPCPVCPFDTLGNCQQVQDPFFGSYFYWTDRNPQNFGDGAFGQVTADDVKFAGSQVDEICWNNWFTAADFSRCDQNVDTTWEIRVYETDPDCPGLPGTQIGISAITVLNKVEGDGQLANTWQYSGSLDAAINLLNGGLAGDTYWVEISCFAETGCGCQAALSRDHGNEHSVSTNITGPDDPRVYEATGIVNSADVGFCENSGIGTPDTVLGTCCFCQGGACEDNTSQRDCNIAGGTWLPCATCAETTCAAIPGNDDCETPFLVSGVPSSADGSETLAIPGENVCAIDDGPGLDSGPNGECAGSLIGGADLHDDVWYAYIAEACGDLTVTSCALTDIDQMIAVYDASGGCPLTDANELTCGDDTCGVGGGPATVTLRVFEGQQLLVRIGGWNNEVPGGFDGDPRGSWTALWSITSTCPSIVPPVAAGDILKNRYISIDRTAGGFNPVSHNIRVTVDSSLVNGIVLPTPVRLNHEWWASAPDPETCISLVTTTKPADTLNWGSCDIVHLTGCPIIPTTTYAIATELNGDVSEVALLDTQAKPGSKWHGDVVGSFDGAVWSAPNGVVNITDAQAVIKTFIVADFAPDKTRTDVHPNLDGLPNNQILNANDILVVILGFKNQEYPGPDLTLCP